MDTLYEEDYDVINNEGENCSERNARIASFGHNEIPVFEISHLKADLSTLGLLRVSPSINCRLSRLGNCFIHFRKRIIFDTHSKLFVLLKTN